jgi:hypothetical protein
MIWRKLSLVKSGEYELHEEVTFEIPYLDEIKNITVESVKKYEHKSLVFIVKSYIQSTNFLKNKYQELKIKVQNIHVKNHSTGELIQKVEASKLLKIVSSYKHKITEITHKIKEEEKDGNNL